MSNNIQSVLTATDFSDVSLNAVQTAAAICQRHGAALRLLHIVNGFDITVPPLGHYAMVGTQLAEAQNAQSAELAKLAADTARRWGIVCSADEATGPVDEAVAAYSTRAQLRPHRDGNSGR